MIASNRSILFVFKATLFCVVFTVLLVLFSLVYSFFPVGHERLIYGIIGVIAALLTIVLFITYEKRSLYSIGIYYNGSTITNFLRGVLVGIVIMGILASSVLIYTDAIIRLNPDSHILQFMIMTIPLLPLALMEELGFRSYPLVILKDRFGIRSSLLITSILFALYHIANGWSFASSFYGPAVWGLLFGLAAVYSKGLAMPTGLHYAVNLTTSAFGPPANSVSIWTVKYPTPVATGNFDWLTIIPSLALLIFAIVLIELYIRKFRNLPGKAIKPST